ncbi:costars family protein ABRACL isoform X1 [Choloepus didactylus]|uniref:costars family protein ABRACL isoform X1 n=1 Tax=Choloepus didactylus TaxID=27675 RepID=UPI0018A0764F|nr:costars family protein ABRACL isoform X1 [Choloepus didactylus]XP_037699783.1 costars family protein ABRACL isoform X1 [Choloepus didactylus]XP_037699784.1 costars family protein ABRACL isoform X1 [Choloepus didactylus]XP_037699785.1 costars family protein ABRACL isoform X1 [Choloepus didactylus]
MSQPECIRLSCYHFYVLTSLHKLLTDLTTFLVVIRTCASSNPLTMNSIRVLASVLLIHYLSPPISSHLPPHPYEESVQKIAEIANKSQCWFCLRNNNSEPEPTLIADPAPLQVWQLLNGTWKDYNSYFWEGPLAGEWAEIFYNSGTPSSAEYRGVPVGHVKILNRNLSLCIYNPARNLRLSFPQGRSQPSTPSPTGLPKTKASRQIPLGHIPTKYCNFTLKYRSWGFNQSKAVFSNTPLEYSTYSYPNTTDRDGQAFQFNGELVPLWPCPAIISTYYHQTRGPLPQAINSSYPPSSYSWTWVAQEVFFPNTSYRVDVASGNLYHDLFLAGDCSSDSLGVDSPGDYTGIGLLSQLFDLLSCQQSNTRAPCETMWINASDPDSQVFMPLSLSLEGTGYFWLCGDKIYIALPYSWHGTCGLVSLMPDIHYRNRLNSSQILNLGSHTSYQLLPPKRQKRSTTLKPLEEKPGTGYAILRQFLPTHRYLDLEAAIKNISLQIYNGFNRTQFSLLGLQRQVTPVAEMELQNLRALGIVHAIEGGLCAFLGEECCFYINESGRVVQDVTKLREIATSDQNVRRSKSWNDLTSSRLFSSFPDNFSNLLWPILQGLFILLLCFLGVFFLFKLGSQLISRCSTQVTNHTLLSQTIPTPGTREHLQPHAKQFRSSRPTQRP